jgi:formylglycine-generating enzyme required for sulfatase activity
LKIENSVGMDFVFIPPGTFMMGSSWDEPGRREEEVQHLVTISKGFYMQTTEVTHEQWQTVMGNNPSTFKDCVGADCPVKQVSWYDAQDFIKNLNKIEGTGKYRLPAEAEWEYACRAGSHTAFSFGNYLTTNQANYNGEKPMPGSSKGEDRHKSVPVASFAPNAWGLYDMHGNLHEWCQDWYGSYPAGAEPMIDPAGPSTGSDRVYRGGSWESAAVLCRSAFRFGYTSGYKNVSLGFRVVMER